MEFESDLKPPCQHYLPLTIGQGLPSTVGLCLADACHPRYLSATVGQPTLCGVENKEERTPRVESKGKILEKELLDLQEETTMSFSLYLSPLYYNILFKELKLLLGSHSSYVSICGNSCVIFLDGNLRLPVHCMNKWLSSCIHNEKQLVGIETKDELSCYDIKLLYDDLLFDALVIMLYLLVLLCGTRFISSLDLLVIVGMTNDLVGYVVLVVVIFS
ncbi:hypothetical protein M9H77_06953 [Catharanthus roseus]|uniref:Uncharacterized protein n=1 Tax=Catharanthus roseus TaxID=4058 RepID=A0ACC0BTY9_CATRO|nr:hypothetical protein M9H77_06953 [Catharanthus roseus]